MYALLSHHPRVKGPERYEEEMLNMFLHVFCKQPQTLLLLFDLEKTLAMHDRDGGDLTKTRIEEEAD